MTCQNVYIRSLDIVDDTALLISDATLPIMEK